jgi:hypothetical protein
MALVVSSCVMLVMATTPTVWAQSSELFSVVGTLTLDDGTPAHGSLAISGDTAIGVSDVVHVFDREPGTNDWVHTATLAPSDGTMRTRGAAIDGNTIVIGAQDPGPIGGPPSGAAFVFERVPGQAWQEVARLRGDPDAYAFGLGVAVSGTTILVSSFVTVDPLDPTRTFLAGVVYVFERHGGGPRAWREVARLTGPTPPPGVLDQFGFFIALDRDTAVVAARFDAELVGAYVFSRGDKPNVWERAAALSLPPSGSPNASVPEVAVDGNTAVVGGGLSFVGPHIFERDHGGPNAWGEVHSIDLPAAARLDISGDLLLVSARVFPQQPSTRFGAYVFARNQGGKDAWGEVTRVVTPGREGETPNAAISGDTAFVGDVRFLFPFPPPTPIFVYVADTDRDGLRDGADPCPRDPLNDVDNRCQRASAVHPVLDELIAQGDVTSETRDRRHIITATFTNTSDTAVQNPFFEVTELSGGNVLLNGDAGRGRIGATLSPDVGDGFLSPGESMTVTFVIRLRTLKPFQFFVTLHGDPVP